MSPGPLQKFELLISRDIKDNVVQSLAVTNVIFAFAVNNTNDALRRLIP